MKSKKFSSENNNFKEQMRKMSKLTQIVHIFYKMENRKITALLKRKGKHFSKELWKSNHYPRITSL
jgi:hypothetical protein